MNFPFIPENILSLKFCFWRSLLKNSRAFSILSIHSEAHGETLSVHNIDLPPCVHRFMNDPFIPEK